MSDLTNYPTENQYESQIQGELSSGTTAPFSLEVEDDVSLTLDTGQTVDFIIDPGTSKEEGITVSAISGTTLTVSARGLPKYKGGAATTTTHSGGAKIIISNNWQVYDDIATAINSKTNLDADNVQTAGTNTHISTTVNAEVIQNVTEAQRDALTGVANGAIVYNTDTGVLNQYISGAWTTFATGTTANATDSSGGKVALLTEAELKAGTDTEPTSGSPGVVQPTAIAGAIQDNSFLFAADGEASDAYAITLTPAVGAYTTGQMFMFTANTANTGAATLDVNGLGAKAILKNNDIVLETGDIEAGQVVVVAYDGTQFQMVSPTAIEVQPVVTPSSQSGSGTTGDQTSATTGNLDIDISPFTSADVLKIDAFIEISGTLNHASNPDGSGHTFIHLTGILGDEFSGWSMLNTSASGSGVDVFNATSVSLPTLLGSWDAALSFTASSAAGTLTFDTPTVDSTNLRFAWETTFTDPGAYSLSITGQIAVTATKLA